MRARARAAVRRSAGARGEEAGGTGGAVRSALSGTGITAGGKTGTAEKDHIPVYDEATGERKFKLKTRKDNDGNLVEYKEYEFRNRTDGWFISIAPLENPQVSIAVVVEDIGQRFGGSTAAPVAAQLILKARDLGLLGERYKPVKVAAPSKKKKKA